MGTAPNLLVVMKKRTGHGDPSARNDSRDGPDGSTPRGIGGSGERGAVPRGMARDGPCPFTMDPYP